MYCASLRLRGPEPPPLQTPTHDHCVWADIVLWSCMWPTRLAGMQPHGRFHRSAPHMQATPHTFAGQGWMFVRQDVWTTLQYRVRVCVMRVCVMRVCVRCVCACVCVCVWCVCVCVTSGSLFPSSRCYPTYPQWQTCRVCVD
jgi:hypothetical protein